MAPLCQSSRATVAVAACSSSISETLQSLFSTFASKIQAWSTPQAVEDGQPDSEKKGLRIMKRKLTDAQQGGVTIGAIVVVLVVVWLGWKAWRKLHKSKQQERKKSEDSEARIVSQITNQHDLATLTAQRGPLSDKEIERRLREKEMEASPRRLSHRRNDSNDSIRSRPRSSRSRPSSRVLSLSLNPITEGPGPSPLASPVEPVPALPRSASTTSIPEITLSVPPSPTSPKLSRGPSSPLAQSSPLGPSSPLRNVASIEANLGGKL